MARRMSLAIVCVVSLVALAGCGGSSSWAPGTYVQMVSNPMITWLEPYTPSPQEYRWRDVADNAYSAAFQSSFAYSGAQLQVDYSDRAPTLTGTLLAQGLKPNFAYQLKLEGQPTTTYLASQGSADPRDWSNLQIGSLGRWWCTDPSHIGNDSNRTDSQLAAGTCDDHWVLGYLLFGFFTTGADGSTHPTDAEPGGGPAVHRFELDSSFHVLWKTAQRSPGANDSAPRDYPITGSTAYAYDSDFTESQPVSVYAEWEADRPRPGQVALPQGEYRCRLLITEESFHSNMGGSWGYDALGGLWAHVLSDENLMFDVVPGT